MLDDQNIAIGIDSSGAEAGGDVVVKKLDEIKSKSGEAGSALDKLGQSQRNAAQGADQHASAMGRLGSAAQRNEAIWNNIGRGTDDARQRARALRTEMENLEKRFDAGAAAQKRYYDTLDKIAALEKAHFLSPGRANMFKIAAAGELKATADALNSIGSGRHGAQSGTIRELTVLFREMSNGNWSRVPGSLMLLAQYSGVFGKLAQGMHEAEGASDGFIAKLGGLKNAMSLLLSVGVGALLAGLTTLVAYMGYKANVAAEEMEDRLRRVGRAGEISGDQIEKFSKRIAGQMNLATSAVQDMVTGFVRNGAIPTTMLESTTQAAAALATTMGGDTKAAADELGTAMTKIAAGDAKALNGAFQELSFTQRTYVTQLIETGHYTEAQTALNQALTESVSGPRGAKAGFHDLSTAVGEAAVDFARASGLAQTFQDIMEGIAKALHEAANNMRDYNKARAEGQPQTAGQAFNAGPYAFGDWVAGQMMGPGGVMAGTPAQQAAASRLNSSAPRGAALPGGLVSMGQANGLTLQQAQALAAVAMAESGGNPNNNWMDNGHPVQGYFQFRGTKPGTELYDLKKQYGSGGITPMEQVQFAIQRIRQQAPDAFNGSVAEMVYKIVTQYERPGTAGAMGDLNRAAPYIGVSPRGTFGPMIASGNAQAAYVNSLATTRASELQRVGLSPQEAQLQANREQLATQYIGQGMKPDDARNLADQIARAMQENPGNRALQNYLQTLQRQADDAGRSPEDRAIADAKYQARLALNNGDPQGTRNLSDADSVKVEATVRADMEAKRKKNMDDYLASLKQEANLAAMLPEDAEKAAAIEKARLILNDGYVQGTKQVSAELAQQITDTLALKRLHEMDGQLLVAQRKATVEQTGMIRAQQAAAGAMWQDRSEQIALEQKLWPYIAERLQEGIKLEDILADKEFQRLETIEKQNAAMEHQNALIQKGIEAARQYSPTAQRLMGLADIQQQRQGAILASYTNAFGTGATRDKVMKEIEAGFDQATWAITHHFYDEFADAIGRLSQYFGGKIGGVLDKIAQAVSQFSALAKGDTKNAGFMGAITDLFSSLFGQDVKDSAAKSAQGFSQMGGIGSSLKSLSGDMKNIFGGGEGTFAQGLGSVLGKMGVGAQIGSIVGTIGSLIAPKRPGVQIGAQVGGAIGGLFGPIGAIIGSVGGGFLGGILGGKTRAPRAGATFSLSDSGQIVSSTNGDKNLADAVGGMADSFIGGLNQIVSALGGTLNGAALSKIQIGTFDGDYRVNTTGATGSTALNRKTPGTKDFNDDQNAAIAYAIAQAIKNGAIQGISAASQRVLQSAKDPLSVLNAVQAYEQLDNAILNMKDPVKGAIADFVDGMKKLNDQFVQAGYTTAELAKVQDYYELQRRDLLDKLEKPYKDFIQQISKGPDSGLSVQGQFQNALSTLGSLEGILHGGGALNPQQTDQFQQTMASVFDLGRQMFGSSTDAFAALRQRLIDDSNLAIGSIEAQAPEEKLADEIAKAAAEQLTATSTTNSLLTDIRDTLRGTRSGGSGGSTPLVLQTPNLRTNGATALDSFGGTPTRPGRTIVRD